MTRRVLVITGSYRPAMIADMHRARMLAWDLPAAGWQPEILAADGSYQPPSCLDTDSDEFFAGDITAHFTKAFLPRLFRALRIGSIGWRALVPMFFKGARLLRRKKFDLVYITTAQFPLFLLGPLWTAFFNVPFVLDIHDPCRKDGPSTPVWARPGLKHALSHWIMKHVESLCVRRAAGVIAVSPEYVRMLERRYERRGAPWLSAGRHAVIPFSVLPHDFEIVSRELPARSNPATTQPARIVYAGAGGPVMLRSFEVFCAALRAHREQHPEMRDRIQIELYGTTLGWREGETKHLLDCAKRFGIGDLVIERPGRITYRQSVRLLLDCDGALILGVNDSGYMPSKLFAYAYSGKPLLAILRKDSAAFALLNDRPSLARVTPFDAAGEPSAAQSKVLENFLEDVIARKQFDRTDALRAFLSSAMAKRHAELFDAVLTATSPAAMIRHRFDPTDEAKRSLG